MKNAICIFVEPSARTSTQQEFFDLLSKIQQ
jgi:hypothetical protein